MFNTKATDIILSYVTAMPYVIDRWAFAQYIIFRRFHLALWINLMFSNNYLCFSLFTNHSESYQYHYLSNIHPYEMNPQVRTFTVCSSSLFILQEVPSEDPIGLNCERVNTTTEKTNRCVSCLNDVRLVVDSSSLNERNLDFND